MDLTLLLEKKDKTQLSIVNYLMSSKHPVKQNDLIRDLSLTKYVFQSNLEELSNTFQKLHSNMRIEKRKIENRIYLTLINGDHGGINKLYHFLLNNSTEYQLLLYFFKNKHRSICDISNKFNISETSIYHYLKELNLFLDTFKIKIKQGMLQGDEINICYFYYHFFLASESLPTDVINDTNENIFIDYLIERLFLELAPDDKVKLKLWHDIIVQRKSILAKKYLNKQNLDFLKSNYFFKEIKNSYHNFYGYRDFNKYESQIMFIYFFIATISTHPSTKFKNGNLSYEELIIPSIIEINNYIFSKLFNQLEISKKESSRTIIRNWIYPLTEIHTQLFFFKTISSPTLLNFEEIYEMEVRKITTTDLIFLDELIEGIISNFNLSFSEKSAKVVKLVYFNMLKQIEYLTKKTISIGIYSYLGYLKVQLLKQKIERIFPKNFKINFEPATQYKNYDLLISDTYNISNDLSFDSYYILYDLGSETDLTNLINIIKNI